MSSYPNLKTYQQLLSEGNLGSQNMNFYDSSGSVIPNSTAIQCLNYYDQDYGSTFQTYGAVANYYERNRRINGAYGNTYYGDCSWLNPINKFNLVQEDQFYYLQDFVSSGVYSRLFIEGLTFFTRIKPDVNPAFYNHTFVDNDPHSYYRVDILGSQYPYTHGGVRPDIIIQQFNDTVFGAFNSEKLYMTYADMQGYGGWHQGYKLKVPCTLMLFNDKLYTPEPIVLQPPSDDPIDNPVDDPIIPPPVPPSSTPESEYNNFGGDTTDTGPTGSPTDYGPIDLYNYTPQSAEYYVPWWKKWFRYQ